jgi:hypothetical protein
MLYLSLVLSAVLLLLANVAARRRGGWFTAFGLCAVALSAGPLCVGLFLPPVALLSLCLAAALHWPAPRLRPRLFLPASLAATAVAFGVPLWFVAVTEREYARLRQEYPYESMEARLAVAPPVSGGRLTDAAEQRLARIEGRLETGPNSWRAYHLRRLHEDTTALFVNSPGFGVARSFRPSAASLARDEEPADPVAQPEPKAYFDWPAEGDPWRTPPPDDPLSQAHEESVLDFVNPRGFGFFKDRRHVAGFRPHRFSRLPEAGEPWAVRRVDLVGLLLHQEPVAYVSENLPRMGELGEAPTRSLDGFEAFGLERLRRGEDLVAGEAAGRVRMLGAIRNATQCVRCHGGARGDLLGAFSYSLWRVER